MSEQPVITVNNLSFKYQKLSVLNNLHFTIKKGEIVALLGPNGAGKTTLINCLLGRLKPDANSSISLFNHSPGHTQVRQLTGVVLQDAQVNGNLTIREHIELFSRYYPAARPIQDTLKIAGLTEVEHRLFSKLSGGQKQRLLFALAICGNPELVFLDEPTVGLDVNSRRDFWKHIRQLKDCGTTVLLTTHYLEEADALADRVLVLNQGRLIQQGTPASIKSQVAGKHIRFKSALSLHDLRALTEEPSIQQEQDYYFMTSVNCEADVKKLLHKVEDLNDLTVTQHDLEHAFVALTQLDEVA